jgi:hypothetical protein
VTSDETRCLLLRAEGLNYDEISHRTGFTHRKVSRCLWKGRGKLTGRVADIESGSECERIEPLLSLIADGDAAAALEARPHLRNCSRCKSTLREYRVAPQRLAAALPIASLAASDHGIDQLVGAVNQLVTGLTERFNGHVIQVQQWLETGSAKKATAVVAASAAIAGGGALATESIDTSGSGLTPAARQLGVSSINDVASQTIEGAGGAATEASATVASDSGPADDHATDPPPIDADNPGLLEPEGAPRLRSREEARRRAERTPGANETGSGDLAP